MEKKVIIGYKVTHIIKKDIHNSKINSNSGIETNTESIAKDANQREYL